MKNKVTNLEIAKAIAILKNAPLELRKSAKVEINGSITTDTKKAKKLESRQAKKLESINIELYKLARKLCIDAGIDDKNCVSFGFRVDLGGSKFKDLKKPKKVFRKSCLKKKESS